MDSLEFSLAIVRSTEATGIVARVKEIAGVVTRDITSVVEITRTLEFDTLL
jgi:hypothetical protein